MGKNPFYFCIMFKFIFLAILFISAATGLAQKQSEGTDSSKTAIKPQSKKKSFKANQTQIDVKWNDSRNAILVLDGKDYPFAAFQTKNIRMRLDEVISMEVKLPGEILKPAEFLILQQSTSFLTFYEKDKKLQFVLESIADRKAAEQAAAEQAQRKAEEEAEEAKRYAEYQASEDERRKAAEQMNNLLLELEKNSGIALVMVEGGSFEMGCGSDQINCGEDEKPVHKVTISPFYMGKFEVTQAQWQAIMGSNPSNFSDCAQCPVEQINWYDVQDFLKKLNAKTGKDYRLPTEAEWEFAARGGRKSKGGIYSGGSTIDGIGWHKGNSAGRTHPVGQKQPNELGLYDMSGNVWEWCADFYANDFYAVSPERDPVGAPNGEYCVERGGSWYYDPEYSRVTVRNGDLPSFRFRSLGFRVVLPVR
jgi:formylglycine-generating enzyme required for sulfatase activity